MDSFEQIAKDIEFGRSLKKGLRSMIIRDDFTPTLAHRYEHFRRTLYLTGISPSEYEAKVSMGLRVKNRIIARFKVHVQGNVQWLKKVV